MEIKELFKKYSKDSENKVHVSSFDSPVGKITGVADKSYVYMVSFEDRSKNIEKKIQALSEELSCHYVEGKNNILQQLEDEMCSYFEGSCKKFTVPIKMIGSEFQKEVWNKLQELQYGSTQTYGDLAKSLGRSSSHARAIGSACGANSHLLVVPCHRLVATGSKGLGTNLERWQLMQKSFLGLIGKGGGADCKHAQ